MIAVLAGAITVCSAGASALAGTADAGAATARSAGVDVGISWGAGREVPGLAALNTAGNARVSSISCSSPGNCSAGGYYNNTHAGEQGFVTVEQDGRWGKAIEVPGLQALDKGENSQLVSVSCGTAGDCVVGGHYFTEDYNGEQGLVAVERNGRWGKAIEVPGLAALNKSGYAAVSSVSCTGAGNCAAGGFYRDDKRHVQGFVVSEQNGRWSDAAEVPGLGALNESGNAWVESLSCVSLGNCAASGHYYTPGSVNVEHGFVVSERNGRWSSAIQVPGVAALDTGGYADASTVSCASAGDCLAGGFYTTAHGGGGFVTVEQNGRWGTAIRVAKGGVSAASCAPAASCLAGGTYRDSSGAHVFVVSEQNGSLGTPVEVPNPGNGTGGTLTSLSCDGTGYCAVSGDYTGPEQRVYGFVIAEWNGTWLTPREMPRPGALGQTGGSRVLSVSCVPAGPCTGGGYHGDASGNAEGFVVNQ